MSVGLLNCEISTELGFENYNLQKDEYTKIFEYQRDIFGFIALDKSDTDILKKLCSLAEVLVPDALASIMMVNPDDGKLYVLEAPSIPPEGIEALNGLQPGPGGGSCGNVVYKKEAQFVTSIATDSRWNDLRKIADAFGLGACWSMPVKNEKGVVLGTFALSSFTDRTPQDFHKAILEFSAYAVSIVLKRSDQRDELQSKNELLEFMAYHDSLTSLSNRSQFYISIEKALKNAKRYNTSGAILYLDLDRFKNLNDIYGHDVGDEILKQFSTRLKNTLREVDTICRLGGDEFVVILDKIDDDGDALRVANKIFDILKIPFSYEDKDFLLRASIGISIFPEDSQNSSELLKKADIAMYSAKSSDFDAMKFYDESMNTLKKDLFNLDIAMQDAIENDKFELFYQPQVDAKTKKLVSAEALIRLKKDGGGYVSPVDFIPIAEESDIINKITLFVVRRALEDLKSWKENLSDDFTLSINISGRDINEKSVDNIISIMDEHEICVGRLELELTETYLMKHTHDSIDLIKRFKDKKLKLAIDDFGSGYSSLSYLKKFKVDVLKIDRLLIRDIEYDEDDLSITKAVVAMGHSLGMKLVAEGVENKNQVDMLSELGVDIFQGFYFDKPLCKGDFEKKYIV